MEDVYLSSHSGEEIDTKLNLLPIENGGTGASSAEEARDLLNIHYCNPNLLDNWYFIGGGSQRGIGALPINTKEQTSYISLSSTTCIDRWTGYNNLDVTLVTGGMLINGSTTSPFPALVQFTKLTTEEIRNKTLTLTIALSTGIVTVTDSIPLAPTTYTNYLYKADAVQHCVIQFYLNSSGKWVVQISSNQLTGITLFAIKLEIGNIQTLAYQENGSWVLNEMPNYDVELFKCNAGVLPVAQGGTGATTAAGARENLGLDAMTATVLQTNMSTNSTATINFNNYDFLIFGCINNSSRIYGSTIVPTALIKNGTITSAYAYASNTVAKFSINSSTNVVTCEIEGSGIYGAVYGMSLI